MDENNSEKRRIPTWAWYIIAIILASTGNLVAGLVLLFILIWCLHTYVKILRQKIKERSKKVIPVQRTLEEIDAMDGYEFEKYMKKIFESLGYLVHHTPLSGDQGADLIITSNEGIRIAVQLKRYSGKVSNKAVQEVVAAKAFHKCTKGMVVTNNSFTDSAIQLARANDVNLVDRIGLTKLLNESFSVIKEKKDTEFPSSQNSSSKDSDGLKFTMTSSSSSNFYSKTNRTKTRKQSW
jgi:Predicted endonuclease distantly related to archaeal Holliday junction resolvase and Mrr-like restriction enzymes